jgi:hypothetical protein
VRQTQEDREAASDFLAVRTVRGDEPAEHEERDRRRREGEREAALHADEPAEEPRDRQGEEDAASVRLATQAGEQRDREHGQEVLGCDHHVPDTVEKRAEPGAHQVGRKPDGDHGVLGRKTRQGSEAVPIIPRPHSR